MESRLSWLLGVVGGVSLSASCIVDGAKGKSPDMGRVCYVSLDGGLVHGAMVRRDVGDKQTSGPKGHAEQVHGELALDGAVTAQLVEDVTFDESGAMRHAEALLTTAQGATTRFVFEPSRGVVDITAGARHLRWEVPHDLPWVMAPLLTSPRTGEGVASPVEARVVWRAAASGRAVRLLDVTALHSTTITADQVVVTDEGEAARGAAVVVLGNDAIDIEAGMPARLHLAALETEIEPIGAHDGVATLIATARCTSASSLPTP